MTFEDPEAEFVQGEIVGRSLPDYVHSRVQGRLTYEFGSREKKFPLFAAPELRVRTAPASYRVIDLAVFAGTQPTGRVPTQPPLVAIEIVSRDDRHSDLVRKLEEYRVWGVRHIWLVDPLLKRLSVYTEAGLSAVSALALPEYELRISIDDLMDGL